MDHRGAQHTRERQRVQYVLWLHLLTCVRVSMTGKKAVRAGPNSQNLRSKSRKNILVFHGNACGPPSIKECPPAAAKGGRALRGDQRHHSHHAAAPPAHA